MATIILPLRVARRLERVRAVWRASTGLLHPGQRAASEVQQPDAPDKGRAAATKMIVADAFETVEFSAKEDRLRAKLMRIATPRPGPTTWINMGQRFRLAAQVVPHGRAPKIDAEHATRLAVRLEAGPGPNTLTGSLASSVSMRTIRAEVIPAILKAYEPWRDEELTTVTVIYPKWSFTPQELDAVSAKRLCNQFRTHLNRAGVTAVPGPLIAFLHGEFEPTSGLYILHFHVLTTVAKAAALKRLSGTDKQYRVKGYVVTPTGSAPIRCSAIGSRERQVSYMLKAFWPMKAVRTIAGTRKRDRRYRRIPEPFATQVLLWLDRHCLADLTVMIGCWSKPKGGSEAMRDLYFTVHGRR